MAAQNIQVQEPENFAAADTLWFEKFLADYLPGNGWMLEYTLTDLSGHQVAQVASVASDTNGNRHKIYQQNFAAALDAADYVFTGEVVNGGTGDRKQIYKAVLTLGADLQDGLATGSQLTENQLDLQAAYASRRVLIARQFTETEDLKSRFVLQKMSEITNLIDKLEEKVIWEKRAARAANGRPDGSTTSPVLRVFC